MSAYLSLTPTGGDELVLFDGVASTWVPLGGQDWGNAVWEHQFAGARGLLGAAATRGVALNRTVRLTLRVYGEDQDHTIALCNALDTILDHMRRLGGRITRRVNGQTERQHMQVITCSPLALGPWDKREDLRGIRDVAMELVCAPYAVGDSMAWTDEAERLPGALVAAAGSLNNLVVSSDGYAGITNASAHLLVDGLRRYRYGDVRVAAYVRPGSTSAGDRRWGVLLRYIDPDNWLAATLEQVSGSGFLRLRSCIAGAQTVLAEGAITSLATTAGLGTWVMGTIEGERVQVCHSYNSVSDSHRFAPPTTWSPSGAGRVSHTLTGSALTMWGPGTEGMVGLYAVPQDASGTGGWARLSVQPSVHSGLAQAANPGPRTEWRMRTNIPGSAPALCEVAVTRDTAAVSGAPVFGLLGWARMRSGWNRCDNGNFSAGHAGGLSNTNGWVVTAVSGITAAATSITAATGGGAATVVLTTTTQSGAAFALSAPEFVAGRTYRATCEVQIAAGAPNVRLVLGTSGDVALGSATLAPAAPGWSTLSVDWTPTATTRGGVHVAIRSEGTAGGSVLVRRVQVVDTQALPTLSTQLEGRGARPPLGVVVPGGGGGLTIESSSGGTLASDATGVSPLFPTRVRVHTITGAGHLSASVLVDPSLIDPDDYTAGESVDVEVWVRAGFSTTVVAPRITGMAAHRRAAIDADTLTPRRTIAPWGLAGKPVTAQGDFWRLIRLGVLTLPTGDRGHAPDSLRLVVRLAWAAGSTGTVYLGGLVLVPARSRMLNPTGVQLSAGGYPSLIGVGDSSAVVTKLIRSDLSGAVRDTQARGLLAAPGMIGSLPEFPAGPDVEVVMVTSTQVPDDPTAAAASCAHPDYLEVAISPTPRWGHLRDVVPLLDVGDGNTLPLIIQ